MDQKVHVLRFLCNNIRKLYLSRDRLRIYNCRVREEFFLTILPVTIGERIWKERNK